MPNRSIELDHVFRALSDPTRRAVLETLRRGPASTSDLARPFEMTLPSFTEHMRTLEDCGLVRSRKAGRIRTYRLAHQPLTAAARWLDRQRSQWEARLDRLDALLLERKESGR